MKTCCLCGTKAPKEQATCSACGEATWKHEDVAEPTPDTLPEATKPARTRRGSR